MDAPLIGITTYLTDARWADVWSDRVALLPEHYLRYAREAGALPVLLPPDPRPGAARAVLARLDGLLLAGGEDLDPARYGAAPDPAGGPPCAERDGWELALLDAAEESGTPVLGVCRGMQVINVHAGGTLVQHLPDRVGHTGHNPRVGVFSEHLVTPVPGTATAGLLAGPTAVATHHHQGIDRLGRGLVAAAHAEDGTIEAIETAGPRFLVGVQWHPERRTDGSAVRALVRAAAAVSR